jgi:hypothetical protein
VTGERVEEPRAQVVAAAVLIGGAAVEPVEVVELRRIELAAGDPRQTLDRGPRPLAFLAQLLALARLELAEEVVERAVAAVVPVELQAGAREEPGLGELGLFVAGAEQPVDRRALGVVGDRADRGDQRRASRMRWPVAGVAGAAITSLG